MKGEEPAEDRIDELDVEKASLNVSDPAYEHEAVGDKN